MGQSVPENETAGEDDDAGDDDARGVREDVFSMTGVEE